YVHKLKGFADFLNQKHKGWTYINVYDRRQSSFLKRFYPNNSIPDFLVLALFFALFSLNRPSDKPLSKPLNSTFAKTFETFSNTPLYSTFNKTFKTFINGIYNTATISTPSNERGGQV